eukprot:GHVU01129496.1.p1 GENE.GHVU01129496.1~~GHVU01129496.1.p1  ORF type:complete len:147 (+),score=5.08 GHVU01129496.1:198-638(+)
MIGVLLSHTIAIAFGVIYTRYNLGLNTFSTGTPIALKSWGYLLLVFVTETLLFVLVAIVASGAVRWANNRLEERARSFASCSVIAAATSCSDSQNPIGFAGPTVSRVERELNSASPAEVLDDFAGLPPPCSDVDRQGVGNNFLAPR